MTSPSTGAPQLSALQRAWLQELGIEKAWLPSAPVAVPIAATIAAPIAVQVVKPFAALPRMPAISLAREAEADTVEETFARASSASSMAELAAMINACQACGLCVERQQAIAGDGVMHPVVMVIGEAPGAFEDRQGKPFVDRPGLMLDNMLSAIQISRADQVYVSNVVKCRPPGNRHPKPTELATCKPYLMRQIALVQPTSLLAVGRAAQALLGTDAPLEQLRQTPQVLDIAGQLIPLIVTHHPFTLLDHPADKAAVWRDLSLLKAVISQ